MAAARDEYLIARVDLTPVDGPAPTDLPAETSCRILTDGKAGDLVQCLGVAGALGLRPDARVLRPRPPWSWLAPRGPVDPREGAGRPEGPLAAPYPDIAIASGRRAVPYLRALKRASGERTFTVFLKDPRIGSRAADIVWVPQHDRLRGPNVVVTLTSPHRVTARALASARETPDVRLSTLPFPRVAMIVGGPSAHAPMTEADVARLAGVARSLVAEGHGLMVTTSRRTPPTLKTVLRAVVDGAADRCFLWEGEGENPYVGMLALAQAIVVTGDSVNMMGEAAATGAPIHIVEAGDPHGKVARFVDALVGRGAACRWAGRLQSFSYEPIDATPVIAGEIARRYRAHRLGQT